MKKIITKFGIIFLALAMVFAFTACGGGGSADSDAAADTSENTAAADTSEDTAAVDGAVYGYDGDDPVIAATYKYMVEVVASENFEKDDDDVSIPQINIVGEPEEGADGDMHVYGDFAVYNYDVEDDEGILETESGGSFPGLMHVAKLDDGTYSVTALDAVADGGAFESSAQEIFGDRYEDFMKVYSDDAAKDEARKAAIRTFVAANGLNVTKYQDYGWDPVDL